MIDFTSALYLGMEHSSTSLPAWPHLTQGKPAALESAPGTSRLEEELARLLGCDRAMLAPSTLHAFCDVFAAVAGPRDTILLDGDAYPIARLAAGCRARPLGEQSAQAGRQLIVADGFLPFRGCSPPIEKYSRAAQRSGGLLIVDDTQAFGLGPGGRGAMDFRRFRGGHVIVVASMAKAFGVPVAVIGGNGKTMARLEELSFSRVHCSPPSAAVVAAALRALEINRRCGDELRETLRGNVAEFRRGLSQLGLVAVRGRFPVQPIRGGTGPEAAALHEFLEKRGVNALLGRTSGSGAAQVVFVLTARHSLAQLDAAVDALKSWRGRAAL